MDGMSYSLDELWDRLLSRQPERVREAFSSLDPESQRTVKQHLHRMATESGWLPRQRSSARAALKALNIPSTKEK
jgi:hypothetical protein